MVRSSRSTVDGRRARPRAVASRRAALTSMPRLHRGSRRGRGVEVAPERIRRRAAEVRRCFDEIDRRQRQLLHRMARSLDRHRSGSSAFQGDPSKAPRPSVGLSARRRPRSATRSAASRRSLHAQWAGRPVARATAALPDGPHAEQRRRAPERSTSCPASTPSTVFATERHAIRRPDPARAIADGRRGWPVVDGRASAAFHFTWRPDGEAVGRCSRTIEAALRRFERGPLGRSDGGTGPARRPDPTEST